MTLHSYSSPLPWVVNIIIGSVQAESPPLPPVPLSPPFLRSLIGRIIPESPDSSTAPCSLLSSCCAVKWWCFFFAPAEEKNNWTDRKVKAVVLLCYSGENNGDNVLLFFLPNALASSPPSNDSEASVFKVFLMLWKPVKTRMLFTPYDEFYDLAIFIFCVWLFLTVESCKMFLSFGIIQLVNSHTARVKALSNVGVWVFCGSEWGHMLSFSFFLCPDLVIPFDYSFHNICLYCFPHFYFPGFPSFPFSSVRFPFLVCSCKFDVCSSFLFLSCLVWLKLVSFFQEHNIFIQRIIE